MPISAPPLEYNLEHPGTSGRALGPQIGILDDSGSLLPPNSTGEIVVKGSPVFDGWVFIYFLFCFVCLFVYLFVCLFVGLFVGLFVCLFVLFVWSIR
jgi:hypothetical protein